MSRVGGCVPRVPREMLCLWLVALAIGGAAETYAQTQAPDAASEARSRIEALNKAAKYADALPLAEEAVQQAEAQGGPDAVAVAAALQQQIETLIGLARYRDAEPLARRSLAIREKALGPEHPDVAASANGLAIVLWYQGRYGDAQPLYQRALDAREKALGPEHAAVGESLNGLALTNYNLGRYGEAEPLFKRSIAVREKALGPDHSDLAQSVGNLGLVHQAQGRYGEAEAGFKHSLAIDEAALGAEHPTVSLRLNNLAQLYRVLGRYAEAEPLLKRSLAIREKSLGPEHRGVGAVLTTMAGVHADQGRHAEAEATYRRALVIGEKALGPDHTEVAFVLDNLGSVLRQRGKYAEAEPLQTRGLAVREKALGPHHPALALSLNSLALLYQRLERRAEVEAHYARAVSISEKALGPEHPRVGDILCNWGSFLKLDGRFEAAEPHLTRALLVTEKVLGPEHPQTVRATIQLAELYGLMGRSAEAEKLFAKAGAVQSVDMKEFQVYFGTNRKPDPKRAGSFGTERSEELLLGAIKVLVPPPSTNAASQSAGQMLLSRLWGSKPAERPVGNERQLTIRSTEMLAKEELVRSARERLIGSRKYLGQALVFIHGFNNSFEVAVRRAAQLAYDLEFDGPVFAFSWPSREKLLAYLGDREAAQNSSDQLRDFLLTVVAETRARRLHIVAHSMGNYALNEALKSMDQDNLKKLNLGELVLASPDLDVDQYQRTLKRVLPLGATSTVYAASSDVALVVSSYLRDRKAQLGYIPKGGPEKLPVGADLIDVTAVSSEVFSLNHDIYAHSPELIEDLGRIMRDRQRPPPDSRSKEVEKLSLSGVGTYWRYRD